MYNSDNVYPAGCEATLPYCGPDTYSLEGIKCWCGGATPPDGGYASGEQVWACRCIGGQVAPATNQYSCQPMGSDVVAACQGSPNVESSTPSDPTDRFPVGCVATLTECLPTYPGPLTCNCVRNSSDNTYGWACGL